MRWLAMTRKSAKTSRKGSKSATAIKGRHSAKKTAAKKPARVGGSHVRFGVHGMTRIVKAISDAGLEPEFNEAVGHDDKFVTVQRKSLRKIKEFVASRPELADLSREMGECDCPPNDPYCFYI
jgi:hypothetical protein